uniref:Regulator of G protein signaling 9 binding protein n=1 Tax=Eptatretus burgeri TaxID=7764 RepID=A0A8C4Q124_EPTBU
MAESKTEEDLDLLQRTLNERVARYRVVAQQFGGSGDSVLLRDELRFRGHRVQGTAVALRAELTRRLRAPNVERIQRQNLERHWVALSSCLELFESEMRRALELACLFSSTQSACSDGVRVVHTGECGGFEESMARVSQEDEGNQLTLQNDDDVMEMMVEMENKMSVPRWSMVAVRVPGAELHSQLSVGSSSLGGLSAAVSSSVWCDPSQRYATSVLLFLVLIAIALSMMILKLSYDNKV